MDAYISSRQGINLHELNTYPNESNNYMFVDWAEEIGRDKYGLYIDFQVIGVRQRMRWIKPGKFSMGSPENEAGRLDREKQHEVILTKGYWLSDTACTQELWESVMGNNPSIFKGPNRPVENISWYECQKFLKKINANPALPGINLCLPTEAQWEYACRAGTTTPFYFGNTITPDQVNCNYPHTNGMRRYRQETVAVKSLPPNVWGLHEMNGNVWEWCNDWYGDYLHDSISDPKGPKTGEYRVSRGGSWFNHTRFCRSAGRGRCFPGDRDYIIGFRLSSGQHVIRQRN